MASKGVKSKPDNDTRARRQKTLEAPKEPRRPKTHWDHVLEEMVWLSKDFESERKWKLMQAKKVALRASKGMLDHATREEKKLKDEEQRLRKVALNISKDVKKFWMKIEKLVLYKHQLVLDEKKKKALDKQLEFLLGQTERYSKMLAIDLVESYKPSQNDPPKVQLVVESESKEKRVEEEPLEVNAAAGSESGAVAIDEDYDVKSGDEPEDNEDTIEEDEKHITEQERQDELEALQNEVDLPLEKLLEHYKAGRVSRKTSLEEDKNEAGLTLEGQVHGEGMNDLSAASESEGNPSVRRSSDISDNLTKSETHFHELESSPSGDMTQVYGKSGKEDHPYDFNDEQEDIDFVFTPEDERDDETTLSEEEELAKADDRDPADEIAMLQNDSELPIEELLARYKKDTGETVSEDESGHASALSEDLIDSHETKQLVDSDVENTESRAHELNLHTCSERNEGRSKEITQDDGKDSGDKIADAAAAARSAQPTGFTYSTTKVRTKLPFLLKHSLREYQHIGLDWLVSMYEKRLNGILADEMGLGKTIMTISLLAHLACEKGIWGPHLIVVPTSVMLNWETEFLKWCPAFKILTYFGSSKERKLKRQGWMKLNSFHICITTYRLVIQDSKIFKRKKWKYLILDEAHLIKNWKSQRWQTLLNFNSKRRILLTGTPLQNDLMELWSLMHFLMPHIFQSHQEFKDWFCNPIAGMVEGQEKVNKEVIDRLHNVLRPFILRRLKRDVEKQLPTKQEHVIFCRLSKRQRNLYEDFIASSETQATLASGNFFGMISIIMQLRKVCNHPDLFEGRPIVSSYDMVGIDMQLSSAICSMFSEGPFSKVDLEALGFLFTQLSFYMTSWEENELKALATPSDLIKQLGDNKETFCLGSTNGRKLQGTNIFEEVRKAILEDRVKEAKERAASIAWWNSLRCRRKPTYSLSLRDLLTVKHTLDEIYHHKAVRSSYMYSSRLADIVLTPVERFQKIIDLVEAFTFAIPAARAPSPVFWSSKSDTRVFLDPNYKEKSSELLLPLLSPIRPAIVRRQVYFPDRRLIQFDCGKLQELAILLRKLKSEGHRALIFTQMTKMLDILEAFINLYGYTYMRLDGSTQPEERQTLMQRFNTNPKIFLFILSTRSGGVGINLVGADTVIFYDSDWNPAMDQQAQDRCHRIGQTREVNIYRLISECTIEENIMKKANQKRALDDLVIQSGGYNTEFFKKLDPMELFSGHKVLTIKDIDKDKANCGDTEVSLSNADVEAALKRIEDEADYMALKKVEQEEAVDNQEFTEEPVDRPEDDELANEDDLKADEPDHQGAMVVASIKEESLMLNSCADTKEEKVFITLSSQEEDVDMLDDVKQMAVAAAAAGQAISAFENQLRPIDRYAIRFLELWDPIIDEAAMETEAGFEEKEWELGRIEKYKEEMEAEIDDGEEPLVYEKWDADFATEAYRQQVEALAQHQLMEDLENEAKQREAADEADMDSTQNEVTCTSKHKKTKKPKKAKFKSLKKGSLASESKPAKPVAKLEAFTDDYDDNDGGAGYESSGDSDMVSPHVLMNRKRKKGESVVDIEEDRTSKKKSKKSKKSLPGLADSYVKYNQSSELHDESIPSKPSESTVVENDLKPASRSKTMGKISITSMPLKRVVMIKPEKLKKGNLWSRDCVPSPDLWLPQEDAILCAMVHEYGPNWSFVSETLYGMTAGGTYRGRYRHPAYCCERYRELIQRHILSVSDSAVNEKNLNPGSGKALLKVTEENIRTLLNIAAEQPDTEMLLQKHFTCLLSSIWRTSSCSDNHHNLSSCNGLFQGRIVGSVNQTRDLMREPSQRIKIPISSHKLLESALQNISSSQPNGTVSHAGWKEEQPASQEELGLILEFLRATDDMLIPFPSVINLLIRGWNPLQYGNNASGEDHLKASWTVAEKRFRAAANACGEDGVGWALSTFPASDPKTRATKAQSLGKHKLPISDSAKPSRTKSRKVTAEPSETNLLYEQKHSSVPCVSPNDPNLKFDFTRETEAAEEGYWDEIHDNSSAFVSEMTCTELMHCYDPGFIWGLDDISLSPEYYDIK